MRRTMSRAGMVVSAAFLMTVNYAIIRLHGNQKVWKFFAEGGQQKAGDADLEIDSIKRRPISAHHNVEWRSA